jgi:hypothetical protein
VGETYARYEDGHHLREHDRTRVPHQKISYESLIATAFPGTRQRITSSSTIRAISDNLNGTLPLGGKVMAEDGMGFELRALASRNPFIDKLVKQGYQ